MIGTNLQQSLTNQLGNKHFSQATCSCLMVACWACVTFGIGLISRPMFWWIIYPCKFWRLPLDVTTAGHLPPSHLIPSTFLCHTITSSIHILCCLPHFLFPGTSVFNIRCPVYPLSLLCNPYQSYSLHLSPFSLSTYSDQLNATT